MAWASRTRRRTRVIAATAAVAVLATVLLGTTTASAATDARQELRPLLEEARALCSASLREPSTSAAPAGGPPATRSAGSGVCAAATTAGTAEGRRMCRGRATPEGTLCRRHAGLLLARSAVAPAQLTDHYSSALQRAVDALEERRAKRSAVLPTACPLCDFVEAHAGELAASGAPDSEAALCLRHFEVALERPAASGGAFRAAHIEALRALSDELGELHRKSSWDARDEPKGTEQTSWIRAAHYLGYDARALP